jgi:SagB-type dehydrogenase family enzyme
MKIKLPPPKLKGGKSVEECIFARESIRSYENTIIEDEKISQILWSAQGKKGYKRTVPSAGATYPLEIYLTLKEKGFYHYEYNYHMLELIINEDLSTRLAQACWDQDFITEAYLNIIICAVFSSTTQIYGQRGIRYVFIEVGHCAQNIHLEAISLGLDSVPIGAFEDKMVKKALNLPKDVEPLYIIPVGYNINK